VIDLSYRDGSACFFQIAAPFALKVIYETPMPIVSTFLKKIVTAKRTSFVAVRILPRLGFDFRIVKSGESMNAPHVIKRYFQVHEASRFRVKELRWIFQRMREGQFKRRGVFYRNE
jgi:hypothetical protein